MTKTKIIATVGPASSRLPVLRRTKKAGMDIARINTKYGAVEEHLKVTEKLKKIRKMFSPRDIKIISKIETQKGITNINSLIRESDGIMVARGDLGKNISFEKVPLAQKMIIKRCNEKKKMVVTATEMLLSLMHSKVPERSEVSDIANAVLDGSDAVMLSEETAIGKYPALAVKTMDIVVKETEKQMDKLKR